jgi:hypothetical protein
MTPFDSFFTAKAKPKPKKLRTAYTLMRLKQKQKQAEKLVVKRPWNSRTLDW